MKKESLSYKIKNRVIDLFRICKEELSLTFSDEGMIIFLILVPLAYPLLYAFIYNNEVAREVTAIVVDDNKSSYSREFIRKVDATADVHIIGYAADMEEAKLAMKERKAYGIYYIPAEFSKDINTSKQTYISLFTDMGALLHYKNLLIAATNVSLEMNKHIKIAHAVSNTTDRQDEITASPILHEEVALFNPQNGFASFLIPAVLILIIQQTLLLGIGLSAGTAREHHKAHLLLPCNSTYNGTLRIVLGKALCYIIIYIVISTYVLYAVPRLFRLPQIGDITNLSLFILPYIISCVLFAITLSTFVTNREKAMIIFVFTSVPLLFISGISWPASAIPDGWKWLGYLFPSTHGINGFIKINSTGATLSEVKYEYQALWLLCGLYFITACIVYRHQIILCQQHANKQIEKDNSSSQQQ